MILLTGGSGTLGKELIKLIGNNKLVSDNTCVYENHLWAPFRRHLDITNLSSPSWQWINSDFIKLIVHCAAYTDVLKAESEKELCYQTNVIGTRNLASLGIPMLYISTEYVFDGEKGNYSEEDYPNPKNFYALTKLLGEYESRRTRSVVVRCLFKSRPFKHVSACVDQFTSGDYVDKIAKELVIAINKFDSLPATIHIGFERKSTFELAKETRDVKPCKIEDIEVSLPKDTSLNTSLWKSIRND